MVVEIDENDVLDGKALDDLYGWIDAAPLTRPKKNIARDFSDGVMVSEIIHYYLPRAVDIHNYVAASSTGQKRINWNTLNRKVFAKMNIKLSDITLNHIVEAKPGAIEQVLWDLRRKILEHAGTSPRVDTAVGAARSKSGLAYSYLTRGTPSATNLSKPFVPATSSSARIQYQEAHYGVPVGVQPSVAKTTAPSVDRGKLSSLQGSSGLPPLPKPLPNSRGPKIEVYQEGASEQAESNYQTPGDSNSHSEGNAKSGCPPSQIIYKGHKMVPVESLELKEKELRDLESTKRTLSLKIDRLEKLIDIKDQRIVDLTQQVLNLRTMYERVTQSNLNGNADADS